MSVPFAVLRHTSTDWNVARRLQGCLLALGWEIGEWYTFIRHGTELDAAYEDTLADMTLGSCGAFLAALVVARVASRQ